MLFTQSKWLRCRNCPVKSHANAARVFLGRPCVAGQPLQGLRHPSGNADTEEPPHQPSDALPTTSANYTVPPPSPDADATELIHQTQREQKQSTPTARTTSHQCDICHSDQAITRCARCERFVCNKLRCRPGRTNQCGTCRYQLAIPPQETTDTNTDHCRGIDAAFARIYAERRRLEEHPHEQVAPDNTTSTTAENVYTHPPAPVAPWDDEDAPADYPSGDEDPAGDPTNDNLASNAPPRRQPTAIRARIIRQNRIARAARKIKLEQDRNRAIRLLANPNHGAVASTPHLGIGSGHRTFTIGPILFCRICGATKARSQGNRLARPCRGWAPPGTRATIRARLQGRNYAVYKGLTRHHTKVIPVGNSRPPADYERSTSVMNAHFPRHHHADSQCYSRDFSGAVLPKAKRLRIRGKQTPGESQSGP